MAIITDCDDYATSIQVPQFIKAQKLLGGSPEMNGIRPVMHVGGFCAVFPYNTQDGKFAVRCWHAHLNDVQDRIRKIANFLSNTNLPYFVDFQYIDDGIATSKGVMPIVIMDWVDAKPLKNYMVSIINNPNALDNFASNFLTMTTDLHSKGISHGDLQHGNIMVKNNGSIVLVDYDSMYVPSLAGYSSEISGLWGYQHPARFTMKKLSPKADYFSELIIYTSIKALAKYPELWAKLQIEDTDTLLFSKEDIDSKGYSKIFDDLSHDSYLKQLVDAIRGELACSSIEELKPLDVVEPNESENKKKTNLLESIIELISTLEETNDVRIVKNWLGKINVNNANTKELSERYNQVLILKKAEGERKNREKILQELRSEYNGYTFVDDLRKEWES